MNRGVLAAAIHRRMVDDNRFGYSWEERWGANPEKWTVDGHTFTMKVGDYDCSSSTITAWMKALEGTEWASSLDGATYTGNMKPVFLASGLFEWKPMTFTAEPGDLYLNVSSHVAMCQTQVPDVLSEFSWGDVGAYGNTRGDQSGREAHTGAYYEYPWDGILHYNHKADGDSRQEDEKGKDMPYTFLFQPDDREEIWLYDSGHVSRLTHIDQMKVIQETYRMTVGRDIPCYRLGTRKAPQGARFAQCFDNRAARLGSLADEYRMRGWSV